VLARRHDDAEPSAGVYIDVRINTALADESEIGQALEQGRPDFRPLAYQHQDFSVAETLRKGVGVLVVVVPDRDVVSRELAEARQ
jgi:hypothetical protein